MKEHFKKFLKSSFGLEIWAGEKIIFHSKKRGVKGLVQFILKYGRRSKNLIIFDKRIGRGAALLLIYLKVKEVYAKIGSKMAQKTLKKAKIKFHFQEVVSSIMNKKNDGLCPIEKLSLEKTPEEFFKLVKNQ